MTLKIVHEPSDDTDQSVKIEFTADDDHECGFCHSVSPAKRFGVHWICLDCLSNADDMISDMLHKIDAKARQIKNMSQDELYKRVIELESQLKAKTLKLEYLRDCINKEVA